MDCIAKPLPQCWFVLIVFQIDHLWQRPCERDIRYILGIRENPCSRQAVCHMQNEIIHQIRSDYVELSVNMSSEEVTMKEKVGQWRKSRSKQVDEQKIICMFKKMTAQQIENAVQDAAGHVSLSTIKRTLHDHSPREFNTKYKRLVNLVNIEARQ